MDNANGSNYKNVKVAAIIPVKNEALSIGKVVDDLKRYVDQVIVIDGNSSDKTSEIARSHGAEIFSGGGKGKGHDLRLFQKYIQKTSPEFDIYVMLDGDMTYDPRDISRIIKPIEKDKADVTVGSRHDKIKADPGALLNVTKVGNFLLTRTAGFLYRRADITDVCSGYWRFSEDSFISIPLSSKGFDLECDIFNYAARNYRLKTVPIHFRKRVGYKKLSLLGACKIPFYFLKYFALDKLRNK